MLVKFQRLQTGAGLPLPAYQTEGAAGLDLCSADEVTIKPGHFRRVSSGFNVKIQAGFEGQVRSRSGMAFKHQVVVLNQPGTIDSDYTGELCVMLVNLGHETMTIRRGDRVAQLVVSPVVRCAVQEVDAMPTTERGTGGFGSTGGMPVVEDARIPEGRGMVVNLPPTVPSSYGMLPDGEDAVRCSGPGCPYCREDDLPGECAHDGEAGDYAADPQGTVQRAQAIQSRNRRLIAEAMENPYALRP